MNFILSEKLEVLGQLINVMGVSAKEIEGGLNREERILKLANMTRELNQVNYELGFLLKELNEIQEIVIKSSLGIEREFDSGFGVVKTEVKTEEGTKDKPEQEYQGSKNDPILEERRKRANEKRMRGNKEK
jgi:hypothetical protein